jgi:hypothetical protein
VPGAWRRTAGGEVLRKQSSGCSRTARCGASPGLLVHQINTCRSCEGVKGVSGVGDAPAVSNCAAACDLPAAEEKEAGGARGLSDG